MGDQSDSTYSNILLENIDSDIPIALNFTASTKITLTKDSQAANKLSTKKSSLIISGTERYIDDKCHSKLKTRTVMGDTAPFSSLQCSRGSYVGEYIATLKEQTDFLKNEVFFFFFEKRSQRKK